MTRFNSVPRTRLIALLIVAAFSISAVVVATGYVAAPASAAKKKKCKKGYKKVKGKCKKVKKKQSSTVQKVTSIRLKAFGNQSKVKIDGDIFTNIAKSGELTGEVAVTVGGNTQKISVPFFLNKASTTSHFSKMVDTTFPTTNDGSVIVTVGGVSSASVPIR